MATIIIGKKLLNNNISSTCPHNMVHVSPLTAETGLPVWDTPANFNGFRALASCTDVAQRSQPNFARYLAVSLAGTLYIHSRGLLPPNRILPGAKFTLRRSLAFSYIGSVTAWQSSTGRQQNFAAFSRRRQLYSAGRPSRWASATF